MYYVQMKSAVKNTSDFGRTFVFSKMLMLSESTIIAGVDKSNGKVVLLPVKIPNKN